METKTKWMVGAFVGVIMLLGGIYQVAIKEDRIEVSMDSDKCGTAMLRVTKDDFTLKCGWRIALQADTLVEYYKTYGVDEWVRNNRFVGRNKKDIKLHLIDKGNSFDIIRETRYRKGKQSVSDGILVETYTFTKDRVKITYSYDVFNSAKHKISMRIKKKHGVFIDAFDPNGHTGVLTKDSLFYEGYGNLAIDPLVLLVSPADNAATFNEGGVVAFLCNVTAAPNETLANATLYWSANGSWLSNGTQSLTTSNATESVTFSRTIPHQTSAGTFVWNCEVCNTTGSCVFNESNFTANPMYKPNDITISSPEDDNLNLLNGTGWGALTIYPDYTNATPWGDGFIYINWTHPGHPDNDNITWNISYYGTSNSTRVWAYDGTVFDTVTLANSSVFTYFNYSGLAVDDYFITLQACTTRNTSLCVNDSTSTAIEIFDYSLTTAVPVLRFSPQPNITNADPYGQNATTPFVSLSWLGSGQPSGLINLTLNASLGHSCLSLTANSSYTPSAGSTLTNYSKITIINETDADPDSIWLWATKTSCGTTTFSPFINIEVLR